jgi:hypothetical protein
MNHLAYRGLRLDGPVPDFHRAIDRLRWDTVPAAFDHRPPAHQGRPKAAAAITGDGQAALLEEAP